MENNNNFSPEGRLYQVEYALESVSSADLCLGILADDGVLLAIDIRTKNILIDNSDPWYRFFHLNQNMVCVASGIMSDANVIIEELRSKAEGHLAEYDEPIICEDLVTYASQIKHIYTIQAGKRPFGVSMLYMCWDNKNHFQLYHTDPSGNYVGWAATAIGTNFDTAQSMFRKELAGKQGFNLMAAKDLAVKVLSKTLDTTKLSPDMFKIATLQRMRNDTVKNVVSKRELQRLITKLERLEKEELAAK